MGGFLADVNTVENTKVNSIIIHQAYLSIGLWKESIPRAYRWLGSQFTFPVIIEHLSKYPFLHTDKVVLEKRFEEMGYTKHQSVCCNFFFQYWHHAHSIIAVCVGSLGMHSSSWAHFKDPCNPPIQVQGALHVEAGKPNEMIASFWVCSPCFSDGLWAFVCSYMMYYHSCLCCMHVSMLCINIWIKTGLNPSQSGLILNSCPNLWVLSWTISHALANLESLHVTEDQLTIWPLHIPTLL